MEKAIDHLTFLKMISGSDNNLLKNQDVLTRLIGLMEEEETIRYINENLPEVITNLIDCIEDNNHEIQYLGSSALVNMSSCQIGAIALSETNVTHENNTIPFMCSIMRMCLNSDCWISEQCSKILSNMTRHEILGCELAKLLISQVHYLNLIIDAITDETYSNHGCNLDYLSQTIGNLTQSASFRRYLVENDETVINRLESVIYNNCSTIKKGGVIAVLKNLTFDPDCHNVILGPKFNILPSLLYPLSGPEEISSEDREKLPCELQYLSLDKEREPDVENRKMLLEGLLQLCAIKDSRQFLREKNSYTILRLYYIWESNQINQTICENIIGLLIRTEDEIGCDNLKDLPIPDDIQEKFKDLGV